MKLKNPCYYWTRSCSRRVKNSSCNFVLIVNAFLNIAMNDLDGKKPGCCSRLLFVNWTRYEWDPVYSIKAKCHWFFTFSTAQAPGQFCKCQGGGYDGDNGYSGDENGNRRGPNRRFNNRRDSSSEDTSSGDGSPGDNNRRGGNNRGDNNGGNQNGNGQQPGDFRPPPPQQQGNNGPRRRGDQLSGSQNGNGRRRGGECNLNTVK